MEGKVKLNYLIPPLLRPSQNGKSWQDIQDHLKKKIGLQAKVCKEDIKEYLDKINVFKLAGPY